MATEDQKLVDAATKVQTDLQGVLDEVAGLRATVSRRVNTGLPRDYVGIAHSYKYMMCKGEGVHRMELDCGGGLQVVSRCGSDDFRRLVSTFSDRPVGLSFGDEAPSLDPMSPNNRLILGRIDGKNLIPLRELGFPLAQDSKGQYLWKDCLVTVGVDPTPYKVIGRRNTKTVLLQTLDPQSYRGANTRNLEFDVNQVRRLDGVR